MHKTIKTIVVRKLTDFLHFCLSFHLPKQISNEWFGMFLDSLTNVTWNLIGQKIEKFLLSLEEIAKKKG